MHPTFVLLKKGILVFTRNKAAVLITFLVPVVLIALFGFVFGLYSSQKYQGPSGIKLAVVNLSTEPAATDLVKALQEEKTFNVILTSNDGPNGDHPLTEDDVRAQMHDNQYNFALVLPRDLVSEEKFGIHLKFLSNPRNEIETQMVNGLLQKTIFSRVPQLLGQSLQNRSKKYLGDTRFESFNRAIANTVTATYGGDADEVYQRLIAGDFGLGLLTKPSKKEAAATGVDGEKQAQAEPDIFSKIARIETEQVVGKQVSNPNATRLIGGYGVMFLLMAISGSAAAIFEEKRSGIFQRILAGPTRLSHILWGRFLFGLLLGTVQLAFLFLAGRLLFHIDLFRHAIPLLAVIVSLSAACTAFGMLLAAVSSTAEMAQGLGTFIVLVMSTIGGAWFPISVMPQFIQQFSKFTIVYWSVEGFSAVLWAGKSLIEVLPILGILLGIALFVMVVATWCFKRSAIFD